MRDKEVERGSKEDGERGLTKKQSFRRLEQEEETIEMRRSLKLDSATEGNRIGVLGSKTKQREEREGWLRRMEGKRVITELS